MTAKVEAGPGWMCTIHDAQIVQSQIPAAEMIQPIALSHEDKFSKLNLTQTGLPIVIVNARSYHTVVTVSKDIDSGEENPLDFLTAKGIVQEETPTLSGEGAAFVKLTHYLLSGKSASVEFGQKGGKDYLKITHEMEQRGKLISS